MVWYFIDQSRIPIFVLLSGAIFYEKIALWKCCVAVEEISDDMLSMWLMCSCRRIIFSMYIWLSSAPVQY